MWAWGNLVKGALSVALVILSGQKFASSQVVPSAPLLNLSVISNSAIVSSILPPLSDGGSAISSYKLEWDTDPGVQEIQTITTSVYTGPNEVQSVTTSATSKSEAVQAVLVTDSQGGSFRLVLDTTNLGGSLQSSGSINYNADPSVIATLVSNMANIQPFGVVTVSRTYTPAGQTGTYQLLVTFPLSMGDVPIMTAVNTLTAGASVVVENYLRGNVISGTFKLSFSSKNGISTTGKILSAASADDVRVALESLEGVGPVQVTRGSADEELGYCWTVQFVSPLNSGNVPALIPDKSGLQASSPSGDVYMNVTSFDGNQLGGTFQLQFTHKGQTGTTSSIPFNAEPSVFESALENIPLNIIPPGTIQVSRVGPDPQLGYTWTISFLSDYARTFEGALNSFVFIGAGSSLTGTGSKGVVTKVRTGTIKEIQQIALTSTADLNSSTVMQLEYGGQVTQPISVLFKNGMCNSSQTEVQTITTTTVDTTTSGGDNQVSPSLYFRLIYGMEMTSWIAANPNGLGNCALVASNITTRLETDIPEFNGGVVVTGQSNSLPSQTCTWTVVFVGTIGDINQLQVQTADFYNDVIQSDTIGPIGLSSTSADDTMKTETMVHGQKDAIKAALELLSTVGKVTVTPVTGKPYDTYGDCKWKVTFDTAAGNLNLMKIRLSPRVVNASVGFSTVMKFGTTTATVSEIRAGTSLPVGGFFALSFDNMRSVYVPYNVDARGLEVALEAIGNIGDVLVTRSGADANNGFTWYVTFLTLLGPQDLIVFDDLDMTGTVVNGAVAKLRVGVSPPFNSLDPSNGLPLGSALITDLTSLSLTINELDEGIAYYVRAAAVNSIGQGPFAFSSVPYAIPQPQRPSLPTSTQLTVVDGTTLQVSFEPPLLNGGNDVSYYKIEYSTSSFAPEIQSVEAQCSVVHEIQSLSTSTNHAAQEVQLLFLQTSYSGQSAIETQNVTCDATAGTFALSFNGFTTSPINFGATSGAITSALNALPNVNSVTVFLINGATKACVSGSMATKQPTFQVRFDSVKDMNGNLPLLTADTSKLQGASYIVVSQGIRGSAPLGGSYRLSFRGSVTQDIPAPGNAQVIQTQLNLLDSIPSGGVIVTQDSTIQHPSNRLYRIAFVSPDLGGNLEAIQSVGYYYKMTGSDSSLSIFTDGLETLQQRDGASSPSVAGNQLGGNFTLTYRGHTTDIIDYNVADTVLKSRLEALPNIDTVKVVRVSGPSVYGEYTWLITFLQLPGTFPPGTGDADSLIPNFSNLLGQNSLASISVLQDGSSPIGGTFSITATTMNTTTHANISETASGIPADASASELESYLNALYNLGTVSVSRTDTVTGYQWLVTFNGCKVVNGTDICNEGDVPLLQVDNSKMVCATSPISVSETVRGRGPGMNCGADKQSPCVDYFTNVQNDLPFTKSIASLRGGTAYYVVVSAHNNLGFGYPAVTVPAFQVPTFNPPGAPPAVRLVQSTTSSITVSFEYPRENGGAPVMGFHLYVDDWSGGNPRLAFDGTDQPDVTQFTVSSSSSFYILPNQNYQFYVVAINYCFALNTNKMCISEPSPTAIFTARSPRLPLAPPLPYLNSRSKLDYNTHGNVTIRWFTPIDNGGSVISKYYLNYAAADATTYSAIPLPLSSVVIDAANADRVLEHTVTGLMVGNVYRFYVVAENSVGKSAASPILSVVVGQRAGIDVTQTNVYAGSLYKPTITSVGSTAISITWPMPPTSITGGIPITGYKVLMYPGAQLNTLAHPKTVYNEVQQIQTTVDPKSPTVISFFIPSSGVTSFGISTASSAQADSITFTTSRTSIAQYLSFLSSVPGVGSIDASCVSNFVSGTDFTSFTLTLKNSDGVFSTPLMIHTTPFTSTGYYKIDFTGTDVIGGSFSLSYMGNMTLDLPYDVSAEEMKYALEDLPMINSVTVSRAFNYINGLNRHAYTWTITFDGTPGNLPLIYASAGRLTPLNSNVKISVTEIVSGTPVAMIYDGTGVPEIRYTTAAGLTPSMTYAFAVQPMNALGDGIIGAVSTTVVATSGSAATYTTAAGSSLSLGITANIDEEQIITLQNCDGAVLNLNFSSKSAKFTNLETEAQLVKILSSIGAGPVKVFRSVDSTSTSVLYRVDFKTPGDIPLLSVSQGPNGIDSCSPSVTEFVNGRQNLFTIEPKTASGGPLTDTSIAAGFAGKDVFLVETFYANGTWYRDQGVATYNPQTYTTQAVTILSRHSNDGIMLYLADYLTPYSTAVFATTYFTSNSTPYQVQSAIQTLPNVKSVDVERSTNVGGDVTFLVTFLSNLGNVPLFTSQFHKAEVAYVAVGECEVQTVTIACDKKFTREVKIFSMTNTTVSLKVGFLSSSIVVAVTSPITGAKIQSALNTFYGPNGSPVVTTVTLNPSQSGSTVSITFESPVGPVGDLFVYAISNSGTSTPLTVIQAVRGFSPTTGTFTIAYEGQYTADLDHDASSAQVKDALETLPNIGSVGVIREDIDNGYRWTISFVEMVGNLPMMVASDYRYEIQRLWTEGGNPTPLSGMIMINYGNDSTTVNFDASATELQVALEAMPSIGKVEVSRSVQTNGQFSWLITFRSLIGNIGNLGVSNRQLLGSSAAVYAKEVVAGNKKTLIGPNPKLTVYEKVAGKPDYSAVYTIDSPGSYTTAISQLMAGGFAGQYFDNQWFYGSPVIERVDNSINFDWSSGFITPDSSDYVSVIWSGKLMLPKSDVYTFYLTADDSAVLTLNHSVLINGTDVCCIEHRASLLLLAGVYYDLNVAYIELTGSASISLKYSSSSIQKQVLPSSILFASFPISGGPASTQVLPGIGGYPQTIAYGNGLTTATTGKQASFYIQTKDANGNNQTTDYEKVDPTDILRITIVGGPTMYKQS
eukprot:gene22354-30602_t